MRRISEAVAPWSQLAAVALERGGHEMSPAAARMGSDRGASAMQACGKAKANNAATNTASLLWALRFAAAPAKTLATITAVQDASGARM
jgi:hypothetical protein